MEGACGDMELEINCSEFCDSFPDQELDRRPLHDLCKTTLVSEQSWASVLLIHTGVGVGMVWWACGWGWGRWWGWGGGGGGDGRRGTAM